MKLSTLCLLILMASCSGNGTQNANVRSDSTSAQKVEGNVNADTTIQTDFHTTYTDVIDNLFVFINKKNWAGVNEFYGAGHKKNAAFFKNLFATQNLSKLELINTSKEDADAYVTTKAVKKSDLSTSTMCFILEIENNQILNQRETDCK